MPTLMTVSDQPVPQPRQIRPHFDPTHPLADVAAQHCRHHLGPRRLVGGQVACGVCWELTIRDDERFAVEHDLPRELDVDPDYIDRVAVDQALAGQRVPLTRSERAEVARRRATSIPSHRVGALPALRLVA